MAISVGVANPGKLSSTGVLNPGTISSVGNYKPTNKISGIDVAHPGTISSVGVLGSNKPATTTPSTADPYNDWQKSLEKLIADQKAYVPKIATLDTANVWSKAKQEATKSVSPYYQQVMSDFINRQQTELQRQQTDTVTQKSALDLVLNRLLEDTQLQRARTQEDTTGAQADLRATGAYTARQEGLDFDMANRALSEGVAAAGMADSGLGRQAVEEAQLRRREASNEQVRQLENKIEATDTLMNRTFEDLALKEQRGQEDTTTSKTKIDLDLERFIEDQAYKRDQMQKENDKLLAEEVATQTKTVRDQLVDQWLDSLYGRGYNAADVAATAARYR